MGFALAKESEPTAASDADAGSHLTTTRVLYLYLKALCGETALEFARVRALATLTLIGSGSEKELAEVFGEQPKSLFPKAYVVLNEDNSEVIGMIPKPENE